MEKPKGIDEILDYDEYKAYILSDIWDQKRNERLLFDDYKCVLCGSRSNVQVHHLVYPLHKNYGTESINDLMTVCPDCHKLLDALRKGQRIEFKKYYTQTTSLRCWIKFDSFDAYEKEEDELKNNFDLRNGEIPVAHYITKEKKVGICRGFVTIATYLKLKEKYGSERIQLDIKHS